MLDYSDVDMTWIDEFNYFSIHVVTHGIEEYKRVPRGITFDIVLLPVSWTRSFSYLTMSSCVISWSNTVLYFMETKGAEIFLYFLLTTTCVANVFLLKNVSMRILTMLSTQLRFSVT